MNMDGLKQTYEQFKADILQWKDAHREEYRRFAKMMADGNEMQYLAVCRAIFKQLPGIRREWHPATVHILRQDEIHFQTEREKTPRDIVCPSRAELAVLRQEFRGDG